MSNPETPQPVSPENCAAAAQKVVETLQNAHFIAYFAGGCVRDRLMGSEPKDYDIATNAKPREVRKLFKRTVAVGEHFGVVIVQQARCRIEVATFRSEGPYRDHRRPDSVHFTDSREDAKRRDFTINGLFYDPTADKIIDFVSGRRDIHNKIIRAIGNPDDRLAEDHLRALRAVRFAARFDFTIEEETKNAVRTQARHLAGVSRERIGHELRQMLTLPSAHRAGILLHQLGLDAPVFNEPPQPDNPLAILAGINRAETKPAPFVTALAAIALDRKTDRDPDFIRRWRNAILLTNYERDALRQIFKIFRTIREPDYFTRDTASRKRLCARPLFNQSLRLMTTIDNNLATQVRRDVAILHDTHSGISPEPFINGDDLNAMGIPPGPAFKIILNQVYNSQLREEVTSRKQALELARQLITDD